MSMEPVMINMAVTGAVHKKEDNPDLPVTVDEMVEDVCKCTAMGVTLVHLHARKSGVPSHDPEIFRELISRIRDECDVIITVSTTGRIENDVKKRTAALELKGRYKPEMASITPGSLNFPNQASINSPEQIKAILKKMSDNGIKPEYEIFSTGMINYVNYLRRKGYGSFERPYFNFILGSLGTMPARRSDILHLISTLEPGSIWGAGGIGRFQENVSMMTAELGGHIRVGLEDNLFLDYETRTCASNEDLLKRTLDHIDSAGRRPATADEARSILGL